MVAYWRSNVNKKQLVTIIAPLVVLVVMVPVFRYLGSIYGKIGWYLGLLTNWIIWERFFQS